VRNDAAKPEYDCTWYAEYNACEVSGSDYENFGYIANGACCVCGGGNTSPTTPSSSCKDATEGFFVDEDIENRDCSWLNSNQDRCDYLCRFVDVALESQSLATFVIVWSRGETLDRTVPPVLYRNFIS
jgi:hypothetical protein